MQTRVAVMSIILEDSACAEAVNAVLHQYGQYIIGRMGIPYRARGVNIISIVLDAPADDISSLAGKAGMLPGVTAKAVYSKLPADHG